jgi:hypothetical protein
MAYCRYTSCFSSVESAYFEKEDFPQLTEKFRSDRHTFKFLIFFTIVKSLLNFFKQLLLTRPCIHVPKVRAFIVSGGRILGRNWDKSLKSFPPRYSQSPPLPDLPPSLPSWSKSGLKLVCNVNIAYRNLKSENSQDYAQKRQRNYTFMNSASAHDVQSFVHLDSRLLSFIARAFFLAEDKNLGMAQNFHFTCRQ